MPTQYMSTISWIVAVFIVKRMKTIRSKNNIWLEFKVLYARIFTIQNGLSVHDINALDLKFKQREVAIFVAINVIFDLNHQR